MVLLQPHPNTGCRSRVVIRLGELHLDVWLRMDRTKWGMMCFLCNVILSWLDVQATLLSEVAHALRLLPTFPFTRYWSAIKLVNTMDHALAAFGKVRCHSYSAMAGIRSSVQRPGCPSCRCCLSCQNSSDRFRCLHSCCLMFGR